MGAPFDGSRTERVRHYRAGWWINHDDRDGDRFCRQHGMPADAFRAVGFYAEGATAGSPSDSMSRLAQLKKADAWMTSEIARSSSPARRKRSRCSGPNVEGVALSATEA